MYDSIIEVLNLKGDNVKVTDTDNSQPGKLFISIEKNTRPSICPICGQTLYSKGSDIRTLNHPILQDGRDVILRVKKMKYKCSNPECSYFTSDSFSFAPKGKHSTNILPLLILDKFRKLNVTARDVAEELNVSDSTVHQTFLDTLDLDRLPLTEVISIDEVFLNIDFKHKYALVILDFLTGLPIDFLPSRRDEDTKPYFSAIPVEERNNVKYLICDMYNPYIKYVSKYFRSAKAVIDCFHVIKWINDRLRTYYNAVKRKYASMDRKKLDESNQMTNRNYKTRKQSREMYLLTHYDYFLFSNKENIDYTRDAYYDSYFHSYLDSFQREKLFFSLDDKFEVYRDLREKYIEFDRKAKEDPKKASEYLDEVISCYVNSGEAIFINFADIIEKHRKYILTSYTFVEVTDSKGNKVIRRLSNGPIEQYNSNVKTLKRISKGVKNFEYTRLRLLWATRPDSDIQLRSSDNKIRLKGAKRGKYNKNK